MRFSMPLLPWLLRHSEEWSLLRLTDNRFYEVRRYPNMNRCPKYVEPQRVLGIVYISGGGLYPGLRSARWRSSVLRWGRADLQKQENFQFQTGKRNRFRAFARILQKK